MPILDLRFSNKSIHQLPHPLTGCQEYRDIQCQNLRALVYPKRITLAFRATIKNQRIYETLGEFPHLCIEDARQHVMNLLADKNRLAVQSRRFTVEQAINDLWLPDLQLYKRVLSQSCQNSTSTFARSGASGNFATSRQENWNNMLLAYGKNYVRQQ